MKTPAQIKMAIWHTDQNQAQLSESIRYASEAGFSFDEIKPMFEAKNQILQFRKFLAQKMIEALPSDSGIVENTNASTPPLNERD